MSVCEEAEQSTVFVHLIRMLNEDVVGWVTELTDESEKFIKNL